jgi:serine/threonine-protein kinase
MQPAGFVLAGRPTDYRYPEVMEYEYDETAPLGRGGMAVVYRARRPGKRWVALKRPLPWPDAAARLAREIRILSQIEDDHVMPILRSGTDEAGEPWYSMPIAAGSLRTLWESGRLGQNAEDVCKTVLDDICLGLAAMHDSGFVHRDVTPGNILGFVEDTRELGFRWVIADCGLVRGAPGDTSSDLTGSASRLGTTGYMAPESFGDPHRVTAAADIYSLGRIMASIITGQRPTLVTELLPTSGPWRTIIRELTRAEPDKRPQTMAEALALAQRILDVPAVSEAVSFRVQIDSDPDLQPDSDLWQIASDNAGDYDFMIDEVSRVSEAAVKRFAQSKPDVATTLAEQMSRHLIDGDWGRRSFNSASTPLGWVHAAINGLIAGNRLDLLSDVAPAYCEAARRWDRFSHNGRLRRWLASLSSETGTVVASAIQQADSIDFFRDMASGSRIASPVLASLLR